MLRSVACIVLVVACASILLRTMVARYTTKSRFIDDKNSKFLHLQRTAPDGVDVVFLGSSYVKNHFSTRYFEDRGLTAYNFGISGRHLGDFASMTRVALLRHPKVIIYTLSVEDLYTPVSTDSPELDDLTAFVRTGQSTRMTAVAAWNYVLNLNRIHYFREAIYNQLTTVLGRLDIRPSPSAAPGAHTSLEPRFSPLVNAQINEGADCDIFKTADYARMRVVTCTNGDGIQYGVIDGPWEPEKWPVNELSSLDSASLSLLNDVLRSAREAGTTPIVLLKPTWGQRFEYDDVALRRAIPEAVLDFTHEHYTLDDWCDGNHLNAHGRLKHSGDVFEMVQKFLKSRSE